MSGDAVTGVRLAERLATVLRLDPDASAVEFEGGWTTWGQLATIADDLVQLVASAGSSPVAVGVLLRNRPEIVGAVLGVLLGDGCVVTLAPEQGGVALAADLTALRPPVVVATAEDWQRPDLVAAARELGVLGILVEAGADAGARVVHGLDRVTVGEPRIAAPGVAVEMLTSGTTGPPKRVPLPYAAFERTIAAAGQHYRTGGSGADDAVRLRQGVALVTSPFVHMSGIFRMLLNLCEGRRIALLERFRVSEWVELVRRHRPRAVSLVPAALAMVYDADVDPEVFESVQVVTSGTSALDPDLQRRFEERYEVAVLPSYGATEFAGGVAGWTLALHREWAGRKSGSVGRPQPGRRVRVVDPDSGEAVPAGAQGVLEVGTDGESWVRTTDLARIDEDDFVWIDGRLDDAILRGGFKVFPGEVVEVLRTHPAVLDAGVTGLPDDRLGSVPVAAVELRPGASSTPAELLAHARAHLTGYKVPKEVVIVDALPRTPSMKVSGPGVAALFGDASSATPSGGRREESR